MNNKELANFLQVVIREAEMKTKEEVKKLLEENDLEGGDYSVGLIDGIGAGFKSVHELITEETLNEIEDAHKKQIEGQKGDVK